MRGSAYKQKPRLVSKVSSPLFHHSIIPFVAHSVASRCHLPSRGRKEYIMQSATGMMRPTNISFPRAFWKLTTLPCVLLGSMLISHSGLTAQGGKATAKVDFNRDIRPILSENCYKCHGPDNEARKAKLRFDVRADALKPAKSGNLAIVPGAPE